MTYRLWTKEGGGGERKHEKVHAWLGRTAKHSITYVLCI